VAFKEQTLAFFDELSNITEQQAKDREADMATRDEKPFSNLLTQDDEPTDYQPQNSADVEPTAVTRMGGV